MTNLYRASPQGDALLRVPIAQGGRRAAVRTLQPEARHAGGHENQAGETIPRRSARGGDEALGFRGVECFITRRVVGGRRTTDDGRRTTDVLRDVGLSVAGDGGAVVVVVVAGKGREDDVVCECRDEGLDSQGIYN